MELPYGIADLRERREITESEVSCHVRGCTFRAKRPRHVFRPLPECLCPHHQIYLSPSTYQYADPFRNLLWRDDEDRALLARIAESKRTAARLGRERDEDALTWNVVRAFHREQRLRAFAEVLLAGRLDSPINEEPTVIYWSGDADGNVWSPLQDARREFGEHARGGTEPDVVLWWPGKRLVFVEAKLCSGNRTTPSSVTGDDKRPSAYGAHRIFASVFDATYDDIAVQGEMYELMRMWLLGSWIAERDCAAFRLVNLVRWGAAPSIEAEFGERFCKQAPERRFIRATWEGIWDALPVLGLSESAARLVDAYFRMKSCGYDRDNCLQKAFTDQCELHNGTGFDERALLAQRGARLLWFQSRDAWRRVRNVPTTMRQLIFRILRGGNDAGIDLHHQAATECELDYDIARNIVEAFLASGWKPPEGLDLGLRPGIASSGRRRRQRRQPERDRADDG